MKSKLRRPQFLLFLVFFILITPFLLIGIQRLKLVLGLAKMPVPVIGTGSMYPSLFWATDEGGPEDPAKTNLYPFRTEPLMYRYLPQVTLLGHTFKLRTIGHGDIVSFRNQKTSQILAEEHQNTHAGFIKRVIALPGDKLQIKGGYVYLNHRLLAEPYIYKPRSTYGGSFLPDCQEIAIPPHKLFVMGDNRKISSDSRGELGLVDFSDVLFILPFNEQAVYHDFWRDTSHDVDLANQPTLNVNQFYNQLNQLRSQTKLHSLKPNSLLEKSAKLRAQRILQTNDFSTSATISGYPLSRALAKVGYSNPLTGEFIIQGYYDAQELIQNLSSSLNLKKQLLDPRYQDIGLAVLNGQINNCPTQVIVGHLGGYIPAEYDQATLESWRQLVQNLNEVIPSWESAQQYPNLDQTKLKRLLDILYQRRQLAQEIYQAMLKRQWLTSDQQKRIKIDKQLAQEAEQLINQLNQGGN